MSFSPWIKIEYTTPDKPEVIAMAVKLKLKDSDAVVGKLVRLWKWADENSVDGHEIAITREFIDRLTICKGFAAALQSVGWLIESGGLLTFPHFDRHNGDSAKKRATEARRQQKHRAGSIPAGERDKCHADSVTNVTKKDGQNAYVEEEIEEECTTTTARETLAESLMSAYARPSFAGPALLAALDCLKRFEGKFTFDQILAGVKAVTAASKEWTEDERVTYLPRAENFFREDGWRRHPSDWLSRRETKKRLNGKPEPSPVDIGHRRIAGVLEIPTGD